MVTKRLCIVPCGKRKIWDDNPNAGPTPARKVYTGVFSRTCIMYAEKFCENYVILSAKYGFFYPWEKVPGPYNVTFNDPSTRPISIAKLIRQAREKGLFSYNEYVVLGGKNYVNIVKRVFKGKNILVPLSGEKGMGSMIKKIINSIKNNNPLC